MAQPNNTVIDTKTILNEINNIINYLKPPKEHVKTLKSLLPKYYKPFPFQITTQLTFETIPPTTLLEMDSKNTDIMEEVLKYTKMHAYLSFIMSKTIFVFEDFIFDAIIDTDIDNIQINEDIFLNLPSFAGIIKTSTNFYKETNIKYFLFNTDKSPEYHNNLTNFEIKLIPFIETKNSFNIIPSPILLHKNKNTTFKDIINTLTQEMLHISQNKQLKQIANEVIKETTKQEIIKELNYFPKMLIALFYLCSEKADLTVIQSDKNFKLPHHLTPTKTKNGYKFFEPDKFNIIHVGYNLYKNYLNSKKRYT